jgi:hydroxymethylpyrimidine/phosphomethylpyrimidine kinase
MTESAGRPPVVLAISGHDPTGGAGVQADIEAIAASGAHCVSLITATTAQNTATFAAAYPQPVTQLRRAARLLLEDMPVHACKIGLVGSPAIARFVGELIETLNGVPVVLDPVLNAGTGDRIASPALVRAYRRHLLPRATLVTPNAAECRTLGGSDDVDEAARRLIAYGAKAVLTTGGDEATRDVRDILHAAEGKRTEFRGTRLPHRYHGSGCTLAAAIAARLAAGEGLEAAVAKGRDFTRKALEGAFAGGARQMHPRRLGRPA